MTIKIYVIDDLAVARKYLFNAVKQVETEVGVKAFSSASEALASLEGGDTPDIIFIDQSLPKMNGFEFMSRVRLNPKFRELPIVHMTSGCTEDELKRSFELGCFDVIEKPFSVDRVQAVITKMRETKKNFSNAPDRQIETAEFFLKRFSDFTPAGFEFERQQVTALRPLIHSLGAVSEKLRWNEIARFSQEFTKGLQVVAELNLYSLNETTELVLESLDWLRSQMNAVVNAGRLEAAPVGLRERWMSFNQIEIPTVIQQKLEEFQNSILEIKSLGSEVHQHARGLLAKYPGDKDAEILIQALEKMNAKTEKTLCSLDTFSPKKDQAA